MNDMTSTSPVPNDDGDPDHGKSHDSAKGNDHAEQRTGPNTGPVLDEQQCLAGLSRLLGLLAIGMLRPAYANAMRGVFRDILQHHQRSGRANSDRAVADEDVLAVLRQKPDLLSLLAPFLTDELIKVVMREATGDDEQT